MNCSGTIGPPVVTIAYFIHLRDPRALLQLVTNYDRSSSAAYVTVSGEEYRDDMTMLMMVIVMLMIMLIVLMMTTIISALSDST